MPKSKRKGYAYDDKALMLLAGAAAVVVGFFAIFAYKSNSVVMAPTPNPTVTLALNTQNKSGESGMATLEEVNGKVIVTLTMTGFVKGVSQPAHIHVGACPNPGAVKFPLTSVVNGVSVTTLDVKLAELKTMGALAINVHKSAAQSTVYTSCGDLKL